MIIITGATGALGGAAVEHLLTRMPAAELAVAVRDPDRAAGLAERGVAVRRADYADPASLPEAFAGADALLLVSASDPHADAVALHRAAVDAARAAGVGRILYTSHQGAAPDTPFGPGRDHAATERLLERSGVAWTALRNGFYMHSLTWLLGPWSRTGAIRVPLDGPVSWTLREDEAEAAALLLAAPAGESGPVTLTAREAPTFRKIAAIASDLAGREIAFQEIGEDAWLTERTAAGQPEPMARMLLGMFQAAHRGYFAGTDPRLAELLGREPGSVREFLRPQVDVA